MITVSVRMQVLGVGAGCLDRDLFQYEGQTAVVQRLLLLVLADELAVAGVDALVLITRNLSVRAVHHNWHGLSQLHQQPQQAWQMKDKVWR